MKRTHEWIYRGSTAVAMAVGMLGCAFTVEPALDPSAMPERQLGYVAVLTYSPSAENFSLAIRNVATNKMYGVPLGSNISEMPVLADKLTAIKVPVGTYEVIGWAGGGTLRQFKEPPDTASNARTFGVRGGEVLAIGRFVTDSTFTNRYSHTITLKRIGTSPVSTQEFRDALTTTYANLSRLPFRCLMCSP